MGLLLLWLVFKGQDRVLLINEFREANYGWIILAGVAAMLSHLLRAVRWNQLIAPVSPSPPLSQTFAALLSGYLANLAVPRLGEITRCVLLSRKSRVPFNSLVGTVVTERIFDMVCLFLIVLSIILFQFGFIRNFLITFFYAPLMERGSGHWVWLIMAAFIFMTAGVILLLLLRKKLKHAREGSFFHKIRRHWQGLRSGLFSFTRVSNKPLFITLSFLIWGLYFLMVYLCFFALASTSGLSVSAGLTLLAVGSLGIAAPVPGGLGTYHFLTILTLTELYSIASEAAFSYAFISHFTQTMVIILFGSLGWLFLTLKGRKDIAAQ